MTIEQTYPYMYLKTIELVLTSPVGLEHYLEQYGVNFLIERNQSSILFHSIPFSPPKFIDCNWAQCYTDNLAMRSHWNLRSHP
jgi:hypothetical protein